MAMTLLHWLLLIKIYQQSQSIQIIHLDRKPIFLNTIHSYVFWFIQAKNKRREFSFLGGLISLSSLTYWDDIGLFTFPLLSTTWSNTASTQPPQIQTTQSHEWRLRFHCLSVGEDSGTKWTRGSSCSWPCWMSYLGRLRRCLSPRTPRWRTPGRLGGWGTWTRRHYPAWSAGRPRGLCRAPWTLRVDTRAGVRVSPQKDSFHGDGGYLRQGELANDKWFQ